jgi:hypothetical protein
VNCTLTQKEPGDDLELCVAFRYLINPSLLKPQLGVCGVVVLIALVVAALWPHSYKSVLATLI